MFEVSTLEKCVVFGVPVASLSKWCISQKLLGPQSANPVHLGQ